MLRQPEKSEHIQLAKLNRAGYSLGLLCQEALLKRNPITKAMERDRMQKRPLRIKKRGLLRALPKASRYPKTTLETAYVGE